MCSAKGHVRFALNSDRESVFPKRSLSALALEADMCSALAHVRFGPKADIPTSIGTDQLVDIGCDHFVDFPPGTTFVKQVGETGPLQFRPVCFQSNCDRAV
jgi:hypothetical protein